MKRKHSSATTRDESASKLIKISEKHHDQQLLSEQSNICQLPSEIQSEILNYIDEVIDGANFILTCKDLYHTLYSTHDLFISSRLKRDLGRLLKQVNLPTFKRERNKEAPQKQTKRSFLDETRGLNSLEIKLSATVKEVLSEAKEAESRLQSKQKMEGKVRDWNEYLDTIEKNQGNEIAKLLEDQIFSKCIIKSHSTERMDYRYTYEAKIEIGDVIVEHYAYDEEGCVTNWSLHVSKSNEQKRRFIFAELPEGDDVILSNCEKVREYLGLREKISNKLLLDSLIMALPWQPGWNCVFYGKIYEEPQDDEHGEDDEDGEDE